MERVQLNIRLPVPLVAALKTQAQQQGITLTALVEQQLAGDSKPASSELATQLAAIEQRLVALEQVRLASPTRVKPAPQPAEQVTPPGVSAPRDPITTAELADRTSTNRAAWNTWASKATTGDVRHHPQAGSWKLAGKAALESGGPARWLWEPAT